MKLGGLSMISIEAEYKSILDEEILIAIKNCTESHSFGNNTPGYSYDVGYLDGLKRVKELFNL